MMRVSKGKYIFSNKDMWNLDKVLNEIIHAGLVKFKHSKRHGYPNESIYDYYTLLGYNKSDITQMLYKSSYDEEKVIEFWESCIDKMIFAYKNHPDYFDIEEPLTELDTSSMTHNSFFSFVPKNGYTSADIEAYNEREREYDEDIAARTKEGRELFFKYYDSLWD